MAVTAQGFGRMIGVGFNPGLSGNAFPIDASSSHIPIAAYEISLGLKSRLSAALLPEEVGNLRSSNFLRSCQSKGQRQWRIGKARASGTASVPGDDDGEEGSDGEDLKPQKETQESGTVGGEAQDDAVSPEQAEIGEFRQRLQGMVDTEQAEFSGKDLATLIRNKYGKSYDVQFIRKEFLGRQLLAMNIMWKYQEQRSFPLTEEEYLIRLDGVAEYLRLWGAVAYVRSSLEKTKERPRVGKAVSILIDLDQKGWRKEEWDIR